MSLIEVERLNKNYFTDGVPTGILRDVNLKVEENEFVAIMGPSGSGKSTLLHILGFLERKKIIEETVEMVGLERRLHYETSKLSGGEKQRVAMARALVNNPRMILADEPTGNLDSQSGGIVMDTLKQLNKKGHAVVLVTHESYTASYASRIIHLLDGQVEREELMARRIDEEKMFIK
ncbi:MAG: ABC transporter related protein [Candidatus Giovannonibacteria bacterium GW2011_GWA2_45_21]|uniref:ABC transporter related protein n=1 Tax=Candidatus Giovannonibacteria bacterium GW2011_GWA2_45_21 TaxID=1618649 RepID=A0A0G1Q7A8_9BACT|nr:MAG: ABC transporter related protein [Candidatus Giovannonibacteria bacterium GW2011_GWA2_45_21]